MDKLNVNASVMYLDAEYTKDQNFEGNRPVDVPEFAESVWSTDNVTDTIFLFIFITFVTFYFYIALN
ncbi:hypothetical protein LDP52_16540 [Photobacterium damselae]|uniref:hypothetical protein n=1 Tax=Photobacterium damselae TaxID=38293 RepID=UPI002340298F|nr:hypothetical protein [Photobacterium damselae]MDC4170337.1 hypothetical protein [Photobacterium damselae]